MKNSFVLFLACFLFWFNILGMSRTQTRDVPEHISVILTLVNNQTGIPYSELRNGYTDGTTTITHTGVDRYCVIHNQSPCIYVTWTFGDPPVITHEPADPEG